MDRITVMARFGLGVGLWYAKTNFTCIPLNVNFTCIERGNRRKRLATVMSFNRSLLVISLFRFLYGLCLAARLFNCVILYFIVLA